MVAGVRVVASNPREPGKASLYPTYKIDDETDNEDRAESDIHGFLQSWVRVLIGSRPSEPVGTRAHAAREPAQRRVGYPRVRPVERSFCFENADRCIALRQAARRTEVGA